MMSSRKKENEVSIDIHISLFTPLWTSLVDSALDQTQSLVSQMRWRIFLSLSPPRFGEEMVPHSSHFNLCTLDSDPSVKSLYPEFLLPTNMIAQVGVSLVLDPSVTPP